MNLLIPSSSFPTGLGAASHPELSGPTAAYVCRGCGTEIVNKNAFRKCPVCGIKFG